MKRIWIDTDIGTNPDDATAVTFAVKHPQVELAGISISGSQQEQRKQEALNLLSFLEVEVEVLLGEELQSRHIENAGIEHTIAIGPLTNISRLILDDCYLGHLHIMGGVFSPTNYKGVEVLLDTNMSKDKEAARIVLSQYDNITLSPLNVTANLILEGAQRNQIESRNVFLKNRYEGYAQHLENKFGSKHSQIVLHDVLPICDAIGISSIEKKTCEFKIQADGTFLDLHPSMGQKAVPVVSENPDGNPTPTVKCEVISNVNPQKVISELLQVL